MEKGCFALENESRESFLTEEELVQIEKIHARGLTSAQIIQIFQSRDVRMSEPTFRKYVQMGLLPRSRRVGSKGKHQGSHGVYPCATVRRINTIKQLMARSFTIEDIQRSFSTLRQQIDAVESALDELFQGFEREVQSPRFDYSHRRNLFGDIDQAKENASTLMRTFMNLENELTSVEKAADLDDPRASHRVWTGLKK